LYSAGTAFLTVVPSFKGIEKEFAAQAKRLGEIMDATLDKSMRNAAARAGEHGRKAGDEYGGAFDTAVKDHLDKAEKAIRKIKVDADTDPLERALAKAREEIGLLRDAKIGVDLNEAEFFAEVHRIEQEIRDLDHQNASIEIRTNAAKVLAELRAIRMLKSAVEGNGLQATDPTTTTNTQVGGAHVDTSDAQAKLAALQGLVDALNKRKIRIPADIDAGPALASMRLLSAEIDLMNRREIEIQASVNEKTALASLKQFQSLVKGLKTKISIGIQLDVTKAISELRSLEAAIKAFGGVRRIGVDLDVAKALTDARALHTVLSQLDRMRIRPTIKVDVAASVANVKALQQQLKSLGNVNVSVNVKLNSTAAMTRITLLENRLRALDGRTITIHVNLTGAVAAMALLTNLSRLVNRLNRKNIQVALGGASSAGLAAASQQMGALGQITDFSIGRLGALIALGATIGTAIVPAAAAAAASISAIATAASAAIAGLGVFALGIFGVIKGITALNKAANDRAKANKSLSSSENQIANALDGVRDAHERLKRTQEEVARANARAARAVVDAQQQVIDAQKEALKAEQDLIEAKAEAIRQDQDRAFQLKDNALAQRQAVLDIADAKKELDQVLANKRATDAEREQAQITFEQRMLQLEELKTEGTRLAEDQAKVEKDGADVVIAAQERVADSQKNVAKAQQNLADAIEAQTQAQIDGQRQLLDAQQEVVRSQRQLQQAYVSSATAGGEAFNDLQAAMDNLSPAGRRFATFIFGLKKDFTDLQHIAQEGMLPGLQQAIQSLLPFMPALKEFVGRVAVALGETFVLIANTLKDPVWVRWFSYINATAGPTLKGMAQFALNVATGLVGILNALTGFNGSIGSGLLKWSEMFRDWATNLDTNKGFQGFLVYVRKSAPILLSFFSQLWQFVTRFVDAAAPIGVVVLQAFIGLFDLINKIPVDVLTVLLSTISAVAAAFLVFAGVAALVASPVALIIIAVGAVVAALAILYLKVKPFRDFVNATLHAIGVAAIWLWQNAIKPSVDGIVWLWQNVLAPVFVWLWQNIIKPISDLIGAAIMAVWKFVIEPTFNAIVWIIQNILAPVFSWLYDHVLKPLFDGWVVLVKVLWAVLEVIFGLIQIGVKLVALSFEWAWKLFLKPFFDLIVIAAKATWEFLKPFFSWLAEVWKKDIAPALSWFGDFMSKIWDGVVDIIKVAVRFTVDTVLNDGLLAAYNWLAKKFGVKPDDVHITLPASFYKNSSVTNTVKIPGGPGQSRGSGLADGGYVTGPGGPRDDMISAWLSNGEYVVPAHVVSKLGVGFFDQLIGRKNADDGHGHSHGSMFADGGLVSVLSNAWNALTNPVGFLKEQGEKLLNTIPGGPWLRDTIKGVGHKVVDAVIGTVKRILDAASDAAGGDNASVSGIIGDPNVTFPPWPSSPSASRGDSGVWRNVVALLKSTGPISGAFGNAYRPGDPLWHGSGRAVDWMGFNQDQLATFLTTRRPLELIHRSSTRDYAYTRGRDKGSFNENLMQEHRNHIHIAMDSGGLLMPGLSAIWNGTGEPEAVLTSRQWADISALAGSGGGGTSYHNQFNFRETTLTEGKLQAIERQQAARARVGRAR
jgi:hypothetical protein